MHPKKWLFSERTKNKKNLFLWTLYFHKLLLCILIWHCNPFHTRCLYISRHTFDLFHIMSLKGSIKDNIDELIHEAIKTIRGKKHKIPNEFSSRNYFSVNTDKDKDFTEYCIRYLLENGKLKNKLNNGANSYFKIYSTDPAILNDSNFSNHRL